MRLAVGVDIGGTRVKLGIVREDVLRHARLEAARIERVVVVELLVRLGAGEPNATRVEDDHEVAHVDIRRVGRLVLAAKNHRDPRGKASKRLAGRIDHVPLALGLASFFR